MQLVENKTVKQRIKEAFLRGEVLTSCSSAANYQTADLRKYISMLRRDGLLISDITVESESKPGRPFNKYFIKPEDMPKTE